MTEAVHGNSTDAGNAHELSEFPAADVVDAEGRAKDVMTPLGGLSPFFGEDQTEVPIVQPISHLQFGLVDPMGPEQLDRFSGEVNSPGPLAFGRHEHGLVAALQELSAHADLPLRHIQVAPGQPG